MTGKGCNNKTPKLSEVYFGMTYFYFSFWLNSNSVSMFSIFQVRNYSSTLIIFLILVLNEPPLNLHTV